MYKPEGHCYHFLTSTLLWEKALYPKFTNITSICEQIRQATLWELAGQTKS